MMRRIGVLLALIIIAVLLHTESNVSAQSGRSIQFGQTVTGDLQSAAEDRWTFEGREGDIVDIRLDSTDFDPYLELIAPDGSTLDTDDDGGVGFNAEMRVMLPVDGEYTIIACSFRTGSGVYSLSLDTYEPPQDFTIAYGETREGWLKDMEEADIWTFTGSEGDVVYISMDSTHFKPYLILYDDDGWQLPGRDDEYSSEVAWMLPSTGTYTFQVGAARWTTTTEQYRQYSLTLRQIESHPTYIIQPGETVTAYLQDGYAEWTFIGTAGDTVRIRAAMLTARCLNPILYDAVGTLLVGDDGCHGDTVFLLPVTGEYRIGLSSGIGLYTLSLREGDFAQQISVGETVEDTLYESLDYYQSNPWIFEAQAGDCLVIEPVVFGDYDDWYQPRVRLYDASGQLIAENGSDLNVLALIPATGDYTLLLGGWAEAGPLDYRLSIRVEVGTQCPLK